MDLDVCSAKVTRAQSNGLPALISASISNISQLENSEQELAHQRELVEHSGRLAQIGELAAGVGHEINNPLR